MKQLLIGLVMLITSLSVALGQSAAEVKAKIARKIWQNECAGSVKGLVSWNFGEAFPSLGIGHFIWYPRGVKKTFEESFPAFVHFAQARGVSVPREFLGAAPWANKQAFAQAEVRGQVEGMRRWLSVNTSVQADFIMQRSLASLKSMQAVSRDPQGIQRKYYAVASTPGGMYALIDYVNFKGEGINSAERYKGQGWGLLQVLEEMRPVGQGAGAAHEFSRAAQSVLMRRVNNSPVARGERRWVQGWMNRCKTYAQPLTN